MNRTPSSRRNCGRFVVTRRVSEEELVTNHNRRTSCSCASLLALVWALILVPAPQLTRAEAASGVSIESVDVGIGGFYRVGHLTQIQVTVTSKVGIDNARLELELPDGEGLSSINVNEVSLKAGTNRLRAIAKFGRVNSELAVRIVDSSEQPLATLEIPKGDLPDAVLGSQSLVLTLGSDVGIAKVISARQEKPGQETRHARVEEVAALPTHWLGYGGVSLIVLPAGESGIVGELTAEQLDALEFWVRMGGRLLISSGASAATAIANDGPLASLVPGDFERVQMQRQTSGLESLAGTTMRSLSSFVQPGELSFRLPMVSLVNVDGEVIVSEGLGNERSPMIIRASHGFGHVQFIATDIDQPPFSQWQDGREKILTQLLNHTLGEIRRDDDGNQYANLTQSGFNDLTGQLGSALDQFAGSRLVPFSWIAILIGLYVLLIGPLDYFLLRRLNKRFHWTWFTFPLLVIAGSGLAWWLTQFWKGNEPQINQVNIVDIDSQTGLMRNTTWANVFSPASQKRDFGFELNSDLLPVSEPKGCVATWQGLPGRSFGGMNNARRSVGKAKYRITNDLTAGSTQWMRLNGLPIDIYASRRLSGISWGQVQLSPLQSLAASSDNQLSGTVINPLPVKLMEPRLYFGRSLYPLQSLAAGQRVDVDRFSAMKTINGMLTRTRVDKDYKDLSQPWDRNSFDTGRIVEMMMFHESVGGSKYTSLLDRFQTDIDVTDHLTQKRAILIGKTVESPGSFLDAETGGQHRTETWVRIMLPVVRKRLAGS